MAEHPSAFIGSGQRKISLVRLGGGLGIAACCIGLLIFFAACAGYNAAFMLSAIPLIMSVPGMIITLIGSTCQKGDTKIEDSHPLSAIFVNLMGLIGGVLLVAVWLKWQMFSTGGA